VIVVLGAALAAGMVLGLLGSGGTMVIVPALVYAAHVDPHEAVVISLVVVAATGPVAAWQHRRAGHVHLRASLTFAAASVPASFLGARLSRDLEGRYLMLLFAAMMVASALGVLLRRGEPAVGSPAPRRLVAVAAVVGLATGAVGSGGGFLVVPALVVFAAMPMRDAIGASLVVVTLNTLAALVGKLGGPPIDWELTLAFTAMAVAGSVLGFALARRTSVARLRSAFAIVVLAAAIWILLHSLP
jgi:uncharacterized protein